MPTTQLPQILKARLPVALGMGAFVLASSGAHALAPPPLPATPIVHVGGRDDLRAAQDELRRYREGEKREAAEFERRDVLERQRLQEQMRRDAAAKRAADEDAARQRAEDWQKRVAEEKQQDDHKRAARERAEVENKASLQRRIAESERRAREEDEAMRERFAAIKRERTKPENILSKAYTNYIGVRRCQASRNGRALLYVDDREAADAKAQVKDIETRIMQANPRWTARRFGPGRRKVMTSYGRFPGPTSRTASSPRMDRPTAAGHWPGSNSNISTSTPMPA